MDSSELTLIWLDSILRVPAFFLLEFLCLASEDYQAVMPYTLQWPYWLANAANLLLLFFLVMAILCISTDNLSKTMTFASGFACFVCADIFTNAIIRDHQDSNPSTAFHAVFLGCLGVYACKALEEPLLSPSPFLYVMCLPFWQTYCSALIPLHISTHSWLLVRSVVFVWWVPKGLEAMQTLAGWLEDTAEWIAHMWKLTGTEAVVAELLKLISRPWAMVLFWVASVANQTWMIFVGLDEVPVQCTDNPLMFFLHVVSLVIASPVSLVACVVSVGLGYFLLARGFAMLLQVGGGSRVHVAVEEETGIEAAVFFLFYSLSSSFLYDGHEERVFDLLVIFYLISEMLHHTLFRFTRSMLCSIAQVSRSVKRHGNVVGLFMALAGSSMSQYLAVFTFRKSFLPLLLWPAAINNVTKICVITGQYVMRFMDSRSQTPSDYVDHVDFSSDVILLAVNFVTLLFQAVKGFQEVSAGSVGVLDFTVCLTFGCVPCRGILVKTCQQFARRQRTTVILSLLPKATEAELSAQDDVCPICRGPMISSDECVVTPCQHLFHSLCLRRWLHRSEKCPLCNASVVENMFNRTLDTTETDIEDLSTEINDE